MRVYELAREAGVTSAAVLKAAMACGADVQTAISPIEKSLVSTVREAVEKLGKSDLEAVRAAKKTRAQAISKETVSSEAEKLAAHREAAKAAYQGRSAKAIELPKESKAVEVKKPVAVAAPEKKFESAPAPVKTSSSPEKAPAAESHKLPPIHIRPNHPQQKSAIAPGKISISVAKKPAAAVQSVRGAGLSKAGFQPISITTGRPKPPVGAIKISVRTDATKKPQQQQPAPGARFGKSNRQVDFDDERGTRKGKKDREGQKSFDKFTATHAMAENDAAPVGGGREISLRGAIVVKDLAVKLNVKPNRLIADLMALKILASINQRVEPEVATQIAEKYGYKVVMEHARNRDAGARPVLKAIDADDLIPEDPPESLVPRAPVVTFLGHVDHGKTTLMDYIRKAHVAAGEAGGITQQISAYQVEIAGKKITFLDTPGHAAFSAMRARGARLTDIAVLIIAADDGVMPQTEECIKVARQAGVQVMVAITKADKPTANLDRVRQQLQKRGLTPEEWGGDIICCPVSGVTGEGVDTLLENILVQAEVLELTANPSRRANGYVIESELQQGLGPCATLLVTGGTLKVGDAILIGEHFGKVRALIDDHGRRVKEAPPAMPVTCTGLSGVPEAGAEFRVMLDEKRARTLAEEAAREKKEEELSQSKASSLDALMSRMAAEGHKELNVVVKSDTQGSLEAIVEALHQIKSEKVGLNVIGTGTGNVSMTDVKTAAAGHAIIIGFDIGNDSGVQGQARHDNVRINSFRIIYELIDHVKQSMLDLLPPEYREVVLGHAEIKAIYDIGKLGKIAGSQMLDGRLVAKEKYRILRKDEVIWTGKVQTLRHFKDEVKEVTGQQECGVCFANFEDFREGDVIECYQLEELPRSL